MVEKAKANGRKSHAGNTSKSGTVQLRSLSSMTRGSAANVKYFLTLLHQISRALHALGYTTESLALTRVMTDIERRIFSPSGVSDNIPTMLQ